MTTNQRVALVKPWDGVLTTDDRPSQVSLDGGRKFCYRFRQYAELLAWAKLNGLTLKNA